MEINKEAKAIFLGDSKVGKSAIFSRITQNTFNDYNISTLGTICIPKIHINEKKKQIIINFWTRKISCYYKNSCLWFKYCNFLL